MASNYSIGTYEDSNGFKVKADDGAFVGWVYPMDYIEGSEGAWGAIAMQGRTFLTRACIARDQLASTLPQNGSWVARVRSGTQRPPLRLAIGSRRVSNRGALGASAARGIGQGPSRADREGAQSEPLGFRRASRTSGGGPLGPCLS